MLTTTLFSLDKFPIFAKTSTSFALPVTRIGFLGKPIPPVAACGLPIANEVINEIVV